MNATSDKPWYSKDRLHEIIFEADTREGKIFDVILLIAILISVIVVMLESVQEYNLKFGKLFLIIEWFFTLFFTVEYVLRLYSVHKPMSYATSFFGIIDLFAILPAYLSLVIVGSHSLTVIRGLRLLRVFRVFKLANFMKESQVILYSLKASKAKIFVFMVFVLIMVSIFGSLMYLIEGSKGNEGFDSIPRSVYWAIVTLTTVGYGDISPVTPLGQFVAAIIMIAGYAVIAVPTGIVTAEALNYVKNKKNISTQSCKYCASEGHESDAVYCKFCGERL